MKDERGEHTIEVRNLQRPCHEFLESAESFEHFVNSWEQGTLPKSTWTHSAHVGICAYYAVRYPETMLERMQRGIVRYNVAVGTINSETSGYHATLTQFWATLLAKLAAGFANPFEAACYAVEVFGENRNLHQLYYSFDVVRSREARRVWVQPDLDGPFVLWQSTAVLPR